MPSTLDVINACLASIGSRPATNANSQDPQVLAALAVFNRVSSQLQAQGWWFNTEWLITMNKDTNGMVPVPTNCLSIRPADPRVKFIQRGLFMYDPIHHTFVVNTSIVCNLILLLPMDQLSEATGNYILRNTVAEFYINDDGDENKAKAYLGLAAQARAEFMKENMRMLKINSSNRPTSLQLWSRLQRPMGMFGGTGSDPSNVTDFGHGDGFDSD